MAVADLVWQLLFLEFVFFFLIFIPFAVQVAFKGLV